MLEALASKSLDQISKLDLSSIDDNHQNLLFYAIRQRDNDIVNFLLSKGCNKDHKDNRGKTPLHVAALIGDAKIITSLIEAGAEINPLDDKGKSPLMVAAAKGPLEIVDLLVDFGAHTTLKDKLNQHLGFYAVRSKKVKILKRAIELGNSPHTLNDHHENLHHQVARYGLQTMQSYLYELKVTPYLHNIYRQSPLHLAAKRGDELMVDHYLKYGLLGYLRDQFNLTAEDYAHDYGEIITLFERYDTKTKTLASLKKQPLHRALRLNKLDEAEALLRMSYQIDDKDIFGNKPLFYILMTQDELLLKLALKHTDDYNDIDAFGLSAPFYAILFDNVSFFKLTGMKKDALDEVSLSILDNTKKVNELL